MENMEPKVKSRRGFAAMDPEKVRAIAAKGGVAAHKKGTAHKFTTAEAQAAGRKGGVAPHKSRGRTLPKKDTLTYPPEPIDFGAETNGQPAA